MNEQPGFQGFRRSDGRVGVRNHVLIVPTVVCSAVVCERIAASVPGAVALPHLAGCGQLGPDMQLTHDTLAAYCQHPNVGAVLVVALGCEQVVAQMLAESARSAGKPSAIVSIQGEGGTPRAIAKGTEVAAGLARALERASAREWCGIDTLILSLKCGGSDYTSGLAANPALGRVADRLHELGASTVLGEIAEILGAEHLLAARATSPEVAGRLLRVIQRVESEAQALGLDIRGTQPSPGNIRGGLTTIEEKSLGATHKAGERSPLEDVVPYASRITRKGLTVMDTPGLDVESVTGMVGGGAQVVVFTTGLGTPTGNPIAPVIKITGNARTAQSMADNTDLDVSGILDRSEHMDDAAGRLLDEMLAVCSGKLTSAERLGHREFAIHRRNPTI